MNRSFLNGLAIAFLAAGLGIATPAQADPGYACTPQLEGQYGYEDHFSWQGEGTRYVYLCQSSQWYLIDIQYCTYYGGCISL